MLVEKDCWMDVESNLTDFSNGCQRKEVIISSLVIWRKLFDCVCVKMYNYVIYANSQLAEGTGNQGFYNWLKSCFSVGKIKIMYYVNRGLVSWH